MIFEQEIDQYLELGFALHWIPPGQKFPFGQWHNAPVLAKEGLEDAYLEMVERYTSGALNIGVRTGYWSKPSNGKGLLVVDVDLRSKDHEAECQSALETLIGDTACLPYVASGRGIGGHFYFACAQDDLPKKASYKLAKSQDTTGEGRPAWVIELFSTGHQVVIPPSLHKDTGAPYVWAKGIPDTLPNIPVTVLRIVHAIPTGERNNVVYAKVAQAREGGMSDEGLPDVATKYNELCVPPMQQAELNSIVNSAIKIPPKKYDGEFLYAAHFLAEYPNIRWDTKGWWFFNQQYWEPRTGDFIDTLAQGTIQRFPRKKDKEAKYAKEFSRRMKRLDMLNTVKGHVEVKRDKFDVNPYLFNVANGTYDLFEDRLRDFDLKDYITKTSPMSYIPGTTHDLWTQYLQDVTDNDEELQRYLQKAAGMAMLGIANERAFFVVQGIPHSGKSTFLNTLAGVFGDYALDIDFGTTFGKHPGNGPKPELTRLAGARLIKSCEIDSGLKIDASLLKRITGNDPITARGLFTPEFTFPPTFTLFLCCNEELSLPADNEGLWQRVKRIPFNHHISQEDKLLDLTRMFTTPEIAGNAVLAWCIEGCRMYREEGLEEPSCVVQATGEFRQDMNPLNDWFRSDLVRFMLGGESAASDAYSSYVLWCTRSAVKFPVSQKNFRGFLLANPSVSFKKGNRGNRYLGIMVNVA